MSRMKRVNLIDRVNEALSDLHHNATPKHPSLESDYEQDLYQSWFQDHASFAIEELKYDDVLVSFIRRYGPVYQYGRGGRTLAPSALMRRGNSAYPSRAEDLDLSPIEARQLIKDIKTFNEIVAAWNQSIPEMWQDSIEANEWQEAIDERKDLVRRTYTKTVYEAPKQLKTRGGK